MNNLLNTIPSLTNKISTVEDLTSQVSPISNISENIKMLKDLIEQARDAANKVRLFCKYSYGFSSLPKVKYTCSLYNISTSWASFFLFSPMCFVQVTVPMNFQGDGHVELHPPKNLDDLKAYTAISLMLQRPPGRGDGKRRRRQATEDDMFVLYLGNRDVSIPNCRWTFQSCDVFFILILQPVSFSLQRTT